LPGCGTKRRHRPSTGWCGGLQAQLERKGTPIGALDTRIAAHALSQQSTLVTNNTRELDRVPGLTLENWVQSS
jgi:tRNA(fMet)-specific endonuclease VapC